jgi:hypothetical protein
MPGGILFFTDMIHLAPYLPLRMGRAGSSFIKKIPFFFIASPATGKFSGQSQVIDTNPSKKKNKKKPGDLFDPPLSCRVIAGIISILSTGGLCKTAIPQ